MNVISRNAAAAALFAIGLTAAALPAWPDNFPSRPIHLIVNFAPGGTGDIVARLVGAKLSAVVGQSIVVENRPGAGGTLGARDVINAEPDGYTLTVAQTPEIAINPFFMTNAGYDPRKDLQPIALAGVVPLALVVPGNAPSRCATSGSSSPRYFRMFTARAITRPSSVSDTPDCSVMISFGQVVSGRASVGLKAVALVKPR